jgi:hemolysin activation/secretion protein
MEWKLREWKLRQPEPRRNINLKCRYLVKCLMIWTLINLVFCSTGPRPGRCENTGEPGPVFGIGEFVIEGNTIFHDDRLLPVLKPFLGSGKTAGDVEAARSALEKYHHQNGYPTALVNIPEQTVEDGVVRLEVIESKIRRVKTSGNRYFTRERLLNMMPAFRPGEILFLPAVKQQLARVNRNPDLKVAPVLMPGKKLGTVDVEFKIKDKLPLHGGLEYNNRSTHATSDTRLNASLRYDNLWQKEHSLSLQYQTAPEETEEVQLLVASYGMPSPFDKDDLLTLYGLVSDSDTATAEGISVKGKGLILGLRYMIILPPLESLYHDLVLGIDYKDFDDTIADEIETPLQYLPLCAKYTAVLPDAWGQTSLSWGVTFNLRQASSDENDFEEKRRATDGNFFYTTLELQRDQKLFGGSRLWLKADGQLADQALISNEQYSAGGIESVRGYKESEVVGDDAVHGIAELRLPDLGALLGIAGWIEFNPYLFYDIAAVRLQDPVSGEDPNTTIAGAGVGGRGYLLKWFEYQLDWAVALEETDKTRKDEQLVHFRVQFKF